MFVLKLSYKILEPRLHNVLSTGTNIIKLWLSFCLVDCVRFARYCGITHSCHLFSYSGLNEYLLLHFIIEKNNCGNKQLKQQDKRKGFESLLLTSKRQGVSQGLSSATLWCVLDGLITDWSSIRHIPSWITPGGITTTYLKTLIRFFIICFRIV